MTSSWTARSVAFHGAETSFELLQSAYTSPTPDAALLRGCLSFYYIFDVLYADDRDVRRLPLRDGRT